MATFWLQEAVRLPHVATYRLQETVGAEIVILVTITDEPPRARRLLCNGYKRASDGSEVDIQINMTYQQIKDWMENYELWD